MVKLDASLLRYLNQEDFKILTAVEMGSKNHELVPSTLINSIACLRFGGCGKILVDLTKNKLLGYERGKRYDGYRLTYLGYDYLALNVFRKRQVVAGLGNQIGVGKESDVFICESEEGVTHAIKLHRLGRTCFRRVSEKRDFYTKSKNKTSWMYLSRKAAEREYQFLSFMYHKGMPVPKPIDWNRHVVVMELIDGHLLNHYNLDSFDLETRDKTISSLYKSLMDLVFDFAQKTRLVHGDFNEFNIILKQNQENGELAPIIIDLPQMLPIDHDLAPEYFDRDIECIVDFFKKRFHFESKYVPKWEDVSDQENEPDQMSKFLEQLMVTTPSYEGSIREELKESFVLETEESDYNVDVTSNNSIYRHEKMDDCVSKLESLKIDPLEARARLQQEISRRNTNRSRRDASKTKNIKGSANPVRRRRKTNMQTACEDASAYTFDF